MERRTPRSLALAMTAVALVSFAAAAAGIGVRASYGAQVTGDEPYYLITALSLGRDRNLDIADDIAAGEYRSFHEIPLDEQTAALDGGRRVAPHDPLLPMLLAPAFALGGWVGSKLLLAAMSAALAALLVWIAVWRFGVAVVPAAVTVGIFGASAPLAVYGNQVYPEVPAALAVAGAVAGLTARPGARAAAVVAVSLVALPWLSVKYVPVAAIVAGIGLWRLLSAGRKGVAVVFGVTLALAGAAFALAHIRWYGGLTPYAAGDHFVAGELSVVGVEPNFAGRASRLIGLLVDREFGLAAWQPAWLFVVPALAALLRSRPRGWDALALPLAVGWLTATFIALTMQGWWWPGRQVVVVLPCAVLAVCVWVGAGTRGRLAAMCAIGALGIVSYGWVVVDGVSGRITWVVDFFDTTNPLYQGLRSVMPDYLDVSAMTWALQSLWLAVVGGLALWAWMNAGKKKREGLGGGPPSSRRTLADVTAR